MSGTKTFDERADRTRGGGPPRDSGGGRPGAARWAADLAMGARLAFSGGREGWTRTVLTAVGVGLGVALLLVAASVPTMMSHRQDRNSSRSATPAMADMKPGADTAYITFSGTDYRDVHISGLVLKPDGANPPVPPGLSELPGPGEMAVSPALKDLLDSPDGKLLKERLDKRVVATIGKEGLGGPKELLFYGGGTDADFAGGTGYRIDHFGDESEPGSLPPELLLLVIVGCVVLLLPVAIFIATAVRFGGERRDRRLAALRLVGADARTTRRIAAGEAVFGALLGLLVGVCVFLVLRQFTESITLFDITAYVSDIVPAPTLALLIAVAVPVCSAAVTLLALRGIVIEPLGVVRNTSPRRRRLWWRLLLPAGGLALLAPMLGGFRADGDMATWQAAAGAVLILVGITGLLPWLVEAVVSRLHGGPLPWQLATRRLQLSSGTAARAVSGITIAVAGAVAIQMLFSSVEAQDREATGQDPARAQLQANIAVDSGAEAREAIEKFRTTRGVDHVIGFTETSVARADSGAKHPDDVPVEPVTVGDCATLRELLRIDGCREGDVFLAKMEQYGDGGPEEDAFLKPGVRADLNMNEDGVPAGEPDVWTIPSGARLVKARTDPSGLQRDGIFATPSALDVARLPNADAIAMIELDKDEPDAADHARNTAAALDPTSDVFTFQSSSSSEEFRSIQRGLFAGAAATLLLIGASMIVSMLEQLRERRRLLSVLVAFGTRRATLGWSVLWQTAIPVVLGLGLSVLGGIGLGALLLKMVRAPVAVDWTGVTTMTGIGAAVILLVTALSMPPLWRMMRPEGLRTE